MRKQAVRLEDDKIAGKLVLKAIRGNCSHNEKMAAVMALAALSEQDKERLAALIPGYKTNSFVHPSSIKKQRENCAPKRPGSVRKRSTNRLWCPHGYLPPKLLTGR